METKTSQYSKKIDEEHIDDSGKQQLPAKLHKKFIEFLTSIPNLYDNQGRQAFLNSASLDPELQNQIHVGGTPDQFFQLLIPHLFLYGMLKDGRHALKAILESANAYVGQEKRAYCQLLIQELDSILYRKENINTSSDKQSQYVPPELYLFVNRTNERSRLFDMIHKKSQLNPLTFPLKSYLAFNGIAGQGKSSLLKWICYNTQGRGYYAAYIDFEDNTYQGPKLNLILEEIASQLSIQVSSDSLSTFKSILSKSYNISEDTIIEIFNDTLDSILKLESTIRIVLCLDSTEKANPLTIEVFEKKVLLQYIDAQNFMLVTAGQEDLVWKSTELKNRVERYKLPCLGVEWISEQVEKLADKEGFDVEDNNQPILLKMLQLTLGHPLSNFTLIHFWTRGFRFPLTENTVERCWSQSTIELIEKVIKQHILKGFQFDAKFPNINTILKYFSFPRHIDIGIGRYILTDLLKVNESDLYKIYWELVDRFQQQFLFIRLPDGRYKLDNVVRNIMLQHIRINGRQRFLDIQSKLFEQHQAWVIGSPDDKKIKHFIEKLYHHAMYVKEIQPNDVDTIIQQELLTYLNEYVLKIDNEGLQLNQLCLLRDELRNDEELGELTEISGLVQIVKSYIH